MLKNYLKIAFRNIWRHKLYSAINLMGLTLALTGSLLILLYVVDEFSFDRFHEKSDRIYRVIRQDLDNGEEYRITYTPGQTPRRFIDEVPEVETATRLTKAHSPVVRYKDNVVTHRRIIYADTNFFDVFSYEFIAGNPATALQEPYSVVMTESSARKYFGEDEALGNTLIFNQDRRFDEQPVKVTGIIEDPPHNTSYPFGMVLSFRTVEAIHGADRARSRSSHAFIALRPDARIEDVRAKLPALSRTMAGDRYEQAQEQGHYVGYRLESLTSIHLYSNVEREYIPSGGGNAQYLYILLSVAAFLILIACINYMNLATVQSARRSREIGVRKTVGSTRGALIRQHLIESTLFAVGASVLAVGLTELLLPIFRDFAGKPLAFHYFDQWYVIPALGLLALTVGLLAGSYPAFYLTRFQPAVVFKGRQVTGGREGWMRRLLVIFQFAVSIALIICTGFVFQQLQYLQHKELGFDRENVVIVDQIDRLDEPERAIRFKEALTRQPGIIDAGFVSVYPSRVWGFGDVTLYSTERAAREALNRDSNGTESRGHNFNVFRADHGFVPTLGINMAAGRNFSPTNMRRDSAGILINQAALRALGWRDHPIGKQIYRTGRRLTGRDESGQPQVEQYVEGLKVRGVVEDYHYLSLHHEIEPLVIFPGRMASCIVVRIPPGNPSSAVAEIERMWNEHAPYTPFLHSFLDEEFAATVQEEQRFGYIVGGFAGLTIFIACLGIFGLAAFTTDARAKEISIRKIAGASVANIVMLLTRDTVKWVLVGTLVAVPVGYFVVYQWLQNFAYRIDIGISTFLAGIALALGIAVITVGTQAVRAALKNPAETLRYE